MLIADDNINLNVLNPAPVLVVLLCDGNLRRQVEGKR